MGNNITSGYKIIFDGVLSGDMPAPEIRERLLAFYRGDQRSVNFFFSGKRLVVRKDLTHAAALKYQETLAKAGVPCRIVRQVQAQAPATPGPQPSRLPERGQTQTSPEGERRVEVMQRDFTFRGIIAESWGLLHGVRGEIIGAVILAVTTSSVLIFAGYGLTRLMGELGRNMYLAYGMQYVFGLFGYPLLAGPFMMGVLRATGAQVGFRVILNCLTGRMLLLSFLVTAVDFMIFAALYSLGVDHFYARAGTILMLPVFALTVPLVAVSGLHPVAAFGRFFGLLNRHFIIMASLYPAIALINFFGNFVIIGFVWTVPLFFVANGVLFRNLMAAEKRGTVVGGVYQGPDPAGPRRATGQPVLEGSAGQNFLAAVLVVLIFISAGARLWALHSAYQIHLPDHVAGNSRGLCIHSDMKLHFLTPEGRTERSVDLGAFGLKREPADIELLEDGSLLIGDMDKGTILRCSAEKLTCRKIGPPNNYLIADNFKFLADEKRGLLFLADTNNHRILVQDLEGTYYRIIGSGTRIDYPNDMALDEQGLLWVSNTLHERILCFRVDGDRVTDTGRSIVLDPLASGMTAVGQALTGAQDRGKTAEDLRTAGEDLVEMTKDLSSAAMDMKHARPFALAWGADGNVWVAANNPVGTSGGIRVFDPAGRQVRSVHPAGGAIPEDVIRVGDKMVIADPGRFQIFSMQAEMVPFGDEAFQRALADSRGRLETYETVGKWAKRLLWVMGFATTVLLLFILRKRRAATGAPTG